MSENNEVREFIERLRQKHDNLSLHGSVETSEPEDYLGAKIPAVTAIRRGEEIEPGVYRIEADDGAWIVALTHAQIIDVETDKTGE